MGSIALAHVALLVLVVGEGFVIFLIHQRLDLLRIRLIEMETRMAGKGSTRADAEVYSPSDPPTTPASIIRPGKPVPKEET